MLINIFVCICVRVLLEINSGQNYGLPDIDHKTLTCGNSSGTFSWKNMHDIRLYHIFCAQDTPTALKGTGCE